MVPLEAGVLKNEKKKKKKENKREKSLKSTCKGIYFLVNIQVQVL